jgi:hypothetical protein
VRPSRTGLMTANLIALLKEYGNSIPGFMERVGEDFARGHKEATGGIIQKVSWHETRERTDSLIWQVEFQLLLDAMGVPDKKEGTASPGKTRSPAKGPVNGRSITDFFTVKEVKKKK